MGKRQSSRQKAAKQQAQTSKADDTNATASASSQPPPMKRRQLGRRDSSEKINRQIKTHFGGLSQMELANTLVDGKNVRQRVEEDYAENKKTGGQRMSASYWRNLATEYGVGGNWSTLELSGPSLPSRTALIEALETAVNANCNQRDAEAFGAYMSHVSDLSERELVGIAKTLASSAGIGRKSLDKLWSDLASYLCQTEFRHVSEEYKKLMRREVDQVLQRTWVGLRKNNVKLQTFVASYDNILAWLFPPEYVAVRSCNGRWSTCIPQLQKLTTSSDLGDLLFSFVHDLLNEQALADTIAVRFKAFNFAQVTSQSWQLLQDQLMEDMQAFACSKALCSKRMVKIKFRGATLSLPVSSPTSEMHLRLHARVKELLMGAEGGIPAMMHEKMINFDTAYHSCEWPAGPLDSFRKARALAADILEPTHVTCCGDIYKMLASSKELLCNVDSSFILELTWASSALEELLPASLHRDVWMSMPSRTTAMTMAASLEKLQQLQASQKVSIAPRTCQDEIGAAVEAVAAVARSEAPKIQAGQTAYMSRLLANLQFFVRHEPPVSDGGVGSGDRPHQELVGKAALRAKLKDLKALVSSDGTALTLSRL